MKAFHRKIDAWKVQTMNTKSGILKPKNFDPSNVLKDSVNIRVGPDLFFCRISSRVIRHALPDIAGNPAFYCLITGYPAQPYLFL